MAFRSPYCLISPRKQDDYRKKNPSGCYCDICFYRNLGCEVPTSNNFIAVQGKYYFVVKNADIPTVNIQCQSCKKNNTKVLAKVVMANKEMGYVVECSCGYRFCLSIYAYECQVARALRYFATHEKQLVLQNKRGRIIAFSQRSEGELTSMQIAFKEAGRL